MWRNNCKVFSLRPTGFQIYLINAVKIWWCYRHLLSVLQIIGIVKGPFIIFHDDIFPMYKISIFWHQSVYFCLFTWNSTRNFSISIQSLVQILRLHWLYTTGALLNEPISLRGTMPVRIVKKDDLRTEQHVRLFYWKFVDGDVSESLEFMELSGICVFDRTVGEFPK